MFRMSIDQHMRNLRRIQSFVDTVGAMGMKEDKSDMTQDLLEMSLSDGYPSTTKVRLFLITWGILNYWDEYQATSMIQDILDYRLS